MCWLLLNSVRGVYISQGLPPHPHDAFVTQCARQLTDHVDGFLRCKQYLLHDRDEKFLHGFDRMLRASGVEPVVLPVRSPNLNAHCQRFVRAIKEEALNHMIIMGEATLRYVLTHYLAHYHAERNHQGLGNHLIAPKPEVGHQTGQVVRRERLDGLLSDYYRDAA